MKGTPFILTAGALALGAFAITRLGEAKSLSQSSYFVAEVNPIRIDFSEIELEVVVEIQNPSSLPIELGNVFLQVFADGVNVGLIADTKKRSVPPVSRKHLVFPLVISSKRLLAAAEELLDREALIEVKGYLDIKGFSSPVDYQKTISFKKK